MHLRCIYTFLYLTVAFASLPPFCHVSIISYLYEIARKSSLPQIHFAYMEAHFLSSKGNASPVISVLVMPPSFSP